MSGAMALILLAQAAAPAAPVARDGWVASPIPEPLSEDEACAMFEDKVARLVPELPLRLAHEHHRLRSAVDCAARVYRVEDEVTTPPGALPRDWSEIAQARWDAEFCDSLVTLPLLWRGWRMIQEVRFPGAPTLTFTPTCAADRR
jgi:hypothetical protein